ncbi:transmembrane protein 218-like [Stegodyphus dumicola]|uniref:transmembrane protein 218-like n=1 Tax=Stegodyphus dumicola TaxID=202533 RepID=UPI0015B248F0|nr:transmembrane protein 218-like [Stegodyphus dumicola]
MTDRIFGVGVGVFVIAIVWISAICLAVLFSKTKRPVSFLGFGSILIAFFITVVLLFIPRESQASYPEPEILPPDYLFVWRITLLAFLLVSFIVAIILMITEYWAVPMSAKPLKKVIRKTYIVETK